jgi:hypothetical protein
MGDQKHNMIRCSWRAYSRLWEYKAILFQWHWVGHDPSSPVAQFDRFSALSYGIDQQNSNRLTEMLRGLKVWEGFPASSWICNIWVAAEVLICIAINDVDIIQIEAITIVSESNVDGRNSTVSRSLEAQMSTKSSAEAQSRTSMRVPPQPAAISHLVRAVLG